MNNYNYNPYPSYPSYPNNYYQQGQTNAVQQNNTFAYVNGIEGAKSFRVNPNSTVLLMDSDNPFIYLKTSNAMGQSTLQYFKIVETTEEQIKGINTTPQVEYVSKKDFESVIQRLNKLEEGIKSNG